ncbi:MAG: hypothetical protein AAF772_21185, partial [Acidobacteriota bacterium]
LDLPDGPILLRLDRADVEIVRATAPPRLGVAALRRAIDAPEADDARTADRLAVTRAPEDGRVHIVRRDDQPLRLRLVIDVARRLRVEGSDLNIQLRDDAPEADDESDTTGFVPPPPPPPPSETGAPEAPTVRELMAQRAAQGDAAGSSADDGGDTHPTQLQVERGSVQLDAAVDALVVAVDAPVRAVGTRGALVLALLGGRASVDGHAGELRIEAEGTAVEVDQQNGPLVFWVGGGGDLLVRDSDGPLRAEVAEDGNLRLQDWRGNGTLTAGERSRVEIDGNPDAGSRPISLVTDGADVRIGDWVGSVVVQQTGGRLRGAGLRGRVKVRATGAEVELEDTAGILDLTLLDGADGALRSHGGQARTTVTRSQLELEGVARVVVTAVVARVVARDVGRVDHIDTRRSNVDLDLRGVTKMLLRLTDGSEGRVEVDAPCSVRAQNPETDLLAEGVEVNGCTLAGATGGRTLQGRSLDGRRAVEMTLDIGGGSSLTGVGNP